MILMEMASKKDQMGSFSCENLWKEVGEGKREMTCW